MLTTQNRNTIGCILTRWASVTTASLLMAVPAVVLGAGVAEATRCGLFDQRDSSNPGHPMPVDSTPAGAQSATPKLPVPDMAAQGNAERLVRELYADDYAKPSPTDRQSLAEKLIQAALQTNDDPAGRFVLLRDACDLATQASTALRAVDALAEGFSINAPAMKEAAITKLSAHPTSPSERQIIVQAAQTLTTEAIARDDWPALQRLVSLVRTCAAGATDAKVQLQNST